ncbi:RmlC-like cupin domain-containing protein, partial [Podospora aff. communis PSN243]
SERTTYHPNSFQPSTMAESTSLDEFYFTLSSQNVAPLWTVLDKMVPPIPNPSAAVCAWPYASLRPALLRSGSLITASDAERRVLMLTNPNMTAPYTTDTIYAGLQLILPGETAPAHRHVAFALRFIIEGERGFTAVEGKKLMMERGDVILTPSWHWHDHGSEGEGPMVWLDGLDLPVYRFLPVNFAENYSEARYPSVLAEEGQDGGLKYPWKRVAEALDANRASEPYARLEYRNAEGGHLSRTISAQAERVRVGTTSKGVREMVSFVYHVYEGRGSTRIVTPDGKEETVSWEARDTFSIPAWSLVRHTAIAGEGDRGDAYLFAVNDRPMIEALGLYRREVL